MTPVAVTVDLSTRPTLRLGDSGPDVVSLQNLLNINPVDGKFGPQTEQDVKDFQKEWGLTVVDGIVGNDTWNALAAAHQGV